MYDFESLLDEILKNRPELSRTQIMQRVDEKKRDVGAGFLTDQGALFLIAGELGVQLNHMTSTDLTLKDIYVGANDITIVARILAIYPISEYKRKDGGVGRYRRLNLFDKGNVVRLTIWDDSPDAMKLEGIAVDTPVRVSNGYVKPGLDGKPNLNLGKRGKIEVLGDEGLVSRLTPLSRMVVRVGELGEEPSVLAIEGTVSLGSRFSSFTRSDGSAGSMARFELTDEAAKARVRVVVWNPVAIEVEAGQKVLVTNLRVKKGMDGGQELHGDSGTCIQVSGQGGAQTGAEFVKVTRVGDSNGRINLEVMALSKASAHEATMRDGGATRKAELVVGDDTGEITVIGWKEMADKLAEVEVGQRIRILGLSRRTSKMGFVTVELQSDSAIEKSGS